jgi:hypothetical protein
LLEDKFMLRQDLLTRPSHLALMAGAIALIVCSLARIAGQPFVDHNPIAAAVLTLLVFLIPGVFTGAIAPRSFFLNGVILGIVAAAIVTFQSFHFRQPNWSSVLLYEAIGILACISVPLCVVGSLGGRFVGRRR